MPKIIFFTAALLVLCAHSYGQSLTGNTTPTLGTRYTYTFSDDVIIAQPTWTASPATLGNTWQSGTNYYAFVTWTAGGAGTVTFKDGSTVLATLNVTISGGAPAAPTVNGGYTCGTGSATLTGTVGSGGTEVQWFSTPTTGGYLGTGNSFVTPSISTTTTFYAASYSSSSGLFSTPRTSVVATFNPLPVSYSISGGGTICSGASGVSVSLSGSESNINYQLKINGSNSGAAISGTGGALTWTNQTTAGAYTIVATNATTSCTATISGSATITVNALPTVYAVSGGGTFCSGSSASISLAGSQTGVNYQLKINGTNSGSAVAGTNAALTWTNQTTAGAYTIVATNATTSCAATMSGSATITVNALPSVYTVSGGGTFCTGSSASISLAGSQTGVNYQLKINGTNSGSAVAGTNAAL